MSGLEIGDPAPDFSLDGPDGRFTLSEHRGERVVLLFYPGDDTTVCTKQFCSYRDAGDQIAGLDATLVGISTQDVASKVAFAAKHGLTTRLLADPGGVVATAYGVYSKRFKLAKRTVFVIDEDGLVAHRHANFVSLSYDDVDDLRAALARLPSATGRP
jgi:thioredoxin-dependent peroxiredoxin